MSDVVYLEKKNVQHIICDVNGLKGGYITVVLLAHLAQRAMWAFVITLRPAVRRPLTF